MSYNPILDVMRRKQELMEEEEKNKKPDRVVSKRSVALVITREPGDTPDDYFLDLQVISPEEDHEDGYLVSIANLAANLLEQAMYGEEEEEDEFEFDPEFLGSIDLGED